MPQPTPATCPDRLRHWIGLFALLRADRRASVTVLAAMTLTALFGFGALGVDVGRALDQRVQNQAIADAAALSAAVAYGQGGNDASVLLSTAQDVARLNGLPASAITAATLTADYPASGNSAVKVSLATSTPFSLAAVVTSGSAFNVAASAYALLPTASAAATNPCFLALSSGSNALQTSGGATINMPGCDAAAVGGVFNGGTGINVAKLISGSSSVSNDYGSIAANQIVYSSSWNNPAWNGAVPASDKIVKKSIALSDGLADDTTLAAARGLIGSYTAPNALANPTTTGTAAWNFSFNSPTGPVAAYYTGPGTYVVPAGTYAAGAFTVAGGVKVTFANGSTLSVANGVNIGGGSTVDFGNMNLSVNGGFSSGSSGITLGDGNVSIGSGTVTFSGTNRFGNGKIQINADVTLGGGSSITMGAGNHAFRSLNVGGGSWAWLGNGDLDVTAGIAVGGNSTLAAGLGAYRLGKSSSTNNCIDLSGSAVMIMGDGGFSCSGGIATQGGSRLVFGATPNHAINGTMTIAGSVLFGEGRYTINGNFTNGTGGTTWPFTSSITGLSYGNTLSGVSVAGYDMAGINVTFILNGTVNLAGGAKTKLIASTTSATGGQIADILVESQTSSATTWAAGANSIFVGMAHLPNSDVTMSGGTTTLSGTQCFMLTANTIAVTGGAATGSACNSISSAGGASSGRPTIKLVS